MLAHYKPAIEAAAAVLADYRGKFPGEAFPVIKNKLAPILEGRSTVDRVQVKLFKESMYPIVGQVRRYKKFEAAYQEEREHGGIYLCPSLDLAWQRFVRLKEAGHLILDGPDDYVHTKTDIDRLMVQLAQFGDEKLSRQFASEQRATVFAIEVLFPKTVRDVLRNAFGKGEISVPKLVEQSRFPADYIRVAMADWYQENIDCLHEKGNPLLQAYKTPPLSKSAGSAG